ncbi:nitrilase-related carbon-nitrogen hydrolase, partial [Streptomyces sp. NPDC005180]|uniref:nitrilase-related carbon-nitrogen hydrolase n=1 Tax=Streptomyces sp. NPDC005180 TaxID=3156868 RepID=UPI0033A7814C
AFDWAVRDTVTHGAQLISVPSNNATFGRSEMTYQQLAMSRVRAVEHSRAVVVPVTSGVSAIIRPDGKIVQETRMFTPDALVAEAASPTRPPTAPPPPHCTKPHRTTKHWPCRSPATAASANCAPSSTASTQPTSTPTN